MRIAIIHLVWFIILIITSPCSGNGSIIDLSTEEKAWIKENHTVRVRIGNSPPFMLTDGKVQGIAIDYLTHIFDSNGIKIKYISSSEVTWPEALEYIKRHEVVDMVPTAKITEKRKKDIIFTDEYIFAPWVIFTRSDADFVSSIDDLKGKIVSVEEGYVMHLLLKQNYPEIRLKVVSANLKNFAQIPIKDLSTGLADAYIGNLLSTTYTIQTKGYTNVKVAAPTPFDNHNQAMAIRSDWPELASIINKTLASMTSEEHAAIRNKWLSVRYEYGIDKVYVLKWVLTVTGIASFIIGFILIWNKRLKTEVILRKKTETALMDSEKKFKALFNNAQVALFRTGITDGKLLEINQRYANMAGYPTVEDCMAEFNAADAWADASAREKLVEALQENGFILDYETEIIRRDNVAIWINFSATIFPEKGYIEGSIVDITKRKQAEEKLQNSQHLLNEVGSIARIGGWEHDLVTGEATWTRETYKIVEIESGPVPGPDEHLSYYPSKDRRNLEKAYRLSIETGEQFDLELQATTAKRRSIWVRVVGKPEYRDGNCVKIKGIIQDITDQKKMESHLHQARKLESIGNLAGGIAHDFNNILSSIIGFTELALDDVSKGTPLEDNLQEVYTAGKRARDLVKQILAFARQSDEERKPIKVDTIVKEVMKLMRSTIPTSIEIKENIESDSLIMGNPSQVHQLLMNLCTNAAQAMENAGGILEVRLTDVELNERSALPLLKLKSGNYMKITVSDTGHGIPQDILGSIFEPYFTTKGVGEGTGMGLALAHGIVESYGGEITVESELGTGTVFSIYLPITKKLEDHRPYEKETLPSGTERILFIDDELPIAKMGSQILERLGYQVTVRTSSVEALELFHSKPNEFDLVISDMTMPNMTGDELAMELIAFRSDIPIILCTGYSKKITDEKAAKIGIKAFAYKPIVKAELAKTVRKVLDEAKG